MFLSVHKCEMLLKGKITCKTMPGKTPDEQEGSFFYGEKLVHWFLLETGT